MGELVVGLGGGYRRRPLYDGDVLGLGHRDLPGRSDPLRLLELRGRPGFLDYRLALATPTAKEHTFIIVIARTDLNYGPTQNTGRHQEEATQ